MNNVDETLVNPANVVLEAPNAIAVVPTVVELFVNAPFGIFVKLVPVPVSLVVVKAVAQGTKLRVEVPGARHDVIFADY